MDQEFGLPGMPIEIGRAVSTDGGVVFVIRHVCRSAWFKRLLPSLRSVFTRNDAIKTPNPTDWAAALFTGLR